jgi:hypothetical protein
MAVEMVDLQFSEEIEDQQDYQYESDAASGVVAPILAVRPPGKAAYQRDDQHNRQNQKHLVSPVVSSDSYRSWPGVMFRYSYP